ncbi:MAG TPA: glycosyltransferase family 4 protein [candidate division Zixibacteria bacterium]|nr:glycosyltransferase family 4 protein [candidate division Zixibacteria bacterium]
MKTATAEAEEKRDAVKSGPRRFHLINTIKFWGGGERFMFDLASGLRDRNFDVRVYGRPGKELLRRTEAAGLASVPFFAYFDYDPLPLLKFSPRSGRDVFLAMAPRDLKLLRLLTLLRTEAKLFWYLGVCYPVNNREYRWLLKNEKIRLIAVSKFLKSEILGRVPQVENRISVLPAGVDLPEVDSALARRKLAESCEISPHKLFLGIFSRLVPGKGHSLLFRALQQVKKAGIDFHLWVVGTGERERLEKEAQESGFAQDITFTGFQSDVVAWMAGVDAVCLPSEKEPFGYVVLEGMALGKPVLASASGGPLEILTNGKDGILLPPDNPEAWASAIIELKGNEEKRARLGTAAQRTVKEKFSPERMVASFLEIVDADSAVGRP